MRAKARTRAPACSYEAESRSPKEQRERGGPEEEKEEEEEQEPGARPTARGPRGPLPAPPPACAPSRHLLPRPPGRGRRPPSPWQRAARPAALASLQRLSPSGPKPIPAGLPEARRPHSRAVARDQGRSSGRQAPPYPCT